MVAHAILHLIT